MPKILYLLLFISTSSFSYNDGYLNTDVFYGTVDPTSATKFTNFYSIQTPYIIYLPDAMKQKLTNATTCHIRYSLLLSNMQSGSLEPTITSGVYLSIPPSGLTREDIKTFGKHYSTANGKTCLDHVMSIGVVDGIIPPQPASLLDPSVYLNKPYCTGLSLTVFTDKGNFFTMQYCTTPGLAEPSYCDVNLPTELDHGIAKNGDLPGLSVESLGSITCNQTTSIRINVLGPESSSSSLGYKLDMGPVHSFINICTSNGVNCLSNSPNSVLTTSVNSNQTNTLKISSTLGVTGDVPPSIYTGNAIINVIYY